MSNSRLSYSPHWIQTQSPPCTIKATVHSTWKHFPVYNVKQPLNDTAQLKESVQREGSVCCSDSKWASCQPHRGRGQLGVSRKSWQAWEREDERPAEVWVLDDCIHTNTDTQHAQMRRSHALAAMLIILLLTVPAEVSDTTLHNIC